MTRRLTSIAAVCAVALVAAACASDSKSSPASPTPTSVPATQDTTLSTFSGTWTSVTGTSGQSGTQVPNGCSQFEYKVTPAPDNKSATVDFAAACSSISVQGKGAATLAGSILTWSADGTVSYGSAPACAFSFPSSTATPEGDGIRIVYAGTICGVPVSGSELLHRRQQ
jgi:hypothetical protein